MSFRNVSFFFNLFGRLPLPFLYLISDFFYLLVYRLIGYRKKVVRSNLRNAFPEKSVQERTRIEKAFYRHFCDLFVETLALSQIPTDELLRRVEFSGVEWVNARHKEGRNMATVVGHMGNWEWSSVFSAVCDYDCVVIYKPLHNKSFDRIMFNLRSRHGFRPVAMNQVLREYLLAARENRCINGFFIADQSPMKSEIQYWTRFLNQETAVFTGTEKIAQKFNSLVVYVHVTKPSRGRYRFSFIPIEVPQSPENPHALTEAHVRMLEENIREQPEIWLWSHRRWKHKREEVESGHRH